MKYRAITYYQKWTQLEYKLALLNIQVWMKSNIQFVEKDNIGR